MSSGEPVPIYHYAGSRGNDFSCKIGFIQDKRWESRSLLILLYTLLLIVSLGTSDTDMSESNPAKSFGGSEPKPFYELNRDGLIDCKCPMLLPVVATDFATQGVRRRVFLPLNLGKMDATVRVNTLIRSTLC